MSNNISCGTCAWLRETTESEEREPEMDRTFFCMILADDMTSKDYQDFFCSEHSNREAIKLMREVIQ